MGTSRRSFLKQTGRYAVGGGLVGGMAPLLSACQRPPEPTSEELTAAPGELFFKLSLAEWSLHRKIWAGQVQHLDFAATAKRDFGIDAVEYVSQFFQDKVDDVPYLQEMKQRADDVGVQGLIVMVDMEGHVGHTDPYARIDALERHKHWIGAAYTLGCHSVRVNLGGKGDPDETAEAAVIGLSNLCHYANGYGMNVLVENHGGYSSDGQWLARVMREVDRDNCGTLPDFGNFVMNLFPYQRYDQYQGVRELLPFAKGISAKAHRFDEAGEETYTDYTRMLRIIKSSGYTGHIGIEYEGVQLDEYDGIRATQRLLIRAGRALA